MTSSAERKAHSSSSPVSTLDNNLARFFTHIHPVLLLCFYYLRFDALVADPVPALLVSSVPIATIQLAYLATCLPPASGSRVGSPPAAVRPPKGAKKGRASSVAAAGKGDVGVGGRVVTALLSALLTLVLGPPVLATLMILFGAPLTTHIPHTLLAATHMSLLAILPLVYVHGVDKKKWTDVASALLPLDEAFGGTVGTLLGCWLGAIPIPLDWDREWQKWPVTVLTGAYIGYAVGKFMGGYVFKGKRLGS
ncbi:MAG: Glycosylphosphatidylinositol (GPI) anchor assembly protein [Geoglossum simile]|nr:MAG: Glycosylphosphatidylinositol (GPI) anchor assembly protein [Geoglossum simile]